MKRANRDYGNRGEQLFEMAIRLHHDYEFAVCARFRPKVHSGNPVSICTVCFRRYRCNELRVLRGEGHVTAPP